MARALVVEQMVHDYDDRDINRDYGRGRYDRY